MCIRDRSQAHIAPNASIHLDEFEPAIPRIELELGAEHSAVADVPKEPFQVFGGVAHWFDVDADQATAVAKFAVLGADATPGKQRPYTSVAIHEPIEEVVRGGRTGDELLK